MKKVTISVKMIHSAYMVLSAAKFSSLADADKKKLLLIARAMKPVSTDFSDFAEDVRKALKPTDDYDQKIVKWEETRAGLNAGESENLPMSQKEFREFLYNVITPYNNLVKETLETEEKKEKELEFEPISKEAFDKLASVNEWQVGIAVEMEDIIAE